MSNDALLQILDELKDVIKNGGRITIHDNGGISTFIVPDDSAKNNQAKVSLQDLIDELSNSFEDLDKQYNRIKDKAKEEHNKCVCYVDESDTKYDPSDDEDIDDTDADSFEPGGYDPDGDKNIYELIYKLVDERKELKDKISRLDNALADLDTINKVGPEQYHLLNMQYNSMVAYCNILSERINFLKYDNDLD